jgi:hypothetical protein
MHAAMMKMSRLGISIAARTLARGNNMKRLSGVLSVTARITSAIVLLLAPAMAQAQEEGIQFQEVENKAEPNKVESSLNSYEQSIRKCPCLYEAKHVLGGHAFLPVVEQAIPFADSRASLSLGVGQGSYGVTVAGTNQDVDLIALAPALGVQVAIASRVAVFAGITSVLTSGLNSQSALIYGGSVRYAWDFGAIYEMLRTSDSVLSLAFQVNRPHTLAVSPIQSVVEGIQGALSGNSSSVVNTTVTTEYRPNLRFAHGFNPSLGIEASLGLNFRSTLQNENPTGGTLATASLGLSSDLNPCLSVPIGFTLAYNRNQIISRSESNANSVIVGIFETFTHRFNAGAQVGWLRQGGLDSTIGALLTRLYYN